MESIRNKTKVNEGLLFYSISTLDKGENNSLSGYLHQKQELLLNK